MSQIDNVLPENNSLALVQSPSLDVQSLVMLDCVDFSIFIPANEIISLAARQQLGSQHQTEQACGYVEFSEQRYPVFCMNKSLQIQTQVTEEHQVIVLLSSEQCLFAISCRAISKWESQVLTFFAVPPSMRSRKQLFTQFSIVNNHAVGLSSAAQLLTFLRSRGVTLQLQDNVQSFAQGVI